MKNWLKLIAFSAITFQVHAQQSFTIDGALKYAVDNNVNVKKAKIDQTIASQKVKETIGIGLPQIDANAGYNYYLNIPVQLLPGEILGQPSGTFVPVKFGTKQTINAGVTLNQILFSGSYLVGLESAKTYKETASLAEVKSEISVREAIELAYTAVLVTDENLKTLENNRKVAEKGLNDTEETYKVGLIELQNVEQQQYSYKSLITNQENLVRLREKYILSLKYLLGYPLDQPIILSSTLDEVVSKNETLVNLDANQDIKNHIDYKLIENALRISELKLKLQKSYYLPTLSAAVSSSYNGNNETFGFFNGHQQFFNTSYIALKLDVPIFSGFQRKWQTEQAKLAVKKAELDVEDTERNLKNNIYSTSVDYDNAFNSFKNAQELITLSSSIYGKQQIKFKEGLGTSLELQQAETQLYDSQSQFYQAALDLIKAKTALDKAQGKL